MAPFESRETLEPTAYDGPVSASRRHSRLRHGCEARRARGQQTFSRRNEKLLLDCHEVASRAPWTHTFHAKPVITKKGAVLRATRWKHRARLLLPAAQRSAGPPMLRSPRTGAWGAIISTPAHRATCCCCSSAARSWCGSGGRGSISSWRRPARASECVNKELDRLRSWNHD